MPINRGRRRLHGGVRRRNLLHPQWVLLDGISANEDDGSHSPFYYFPYAREPKQPMCRNSSMSGTSKNVRIRRVSDVAAWLRTSCDDEQVTVNRQESKC